MCRKTSAFLKVAAGVCLAGAMVGCREKASASKETETAEVAIYQVVSGCITQRLEITGDIRPWTTVLLSSKVSGRLERLGVEDENGAYIPLSEGMAVQKGTVLAQIDLEVYAARLQQAQATFNMAEVQLEDARREEKRMCALFEEGAITAQARDKAVTARAVAEAARAQAEAALALAKIEYAEATPRSPMDGVITRKHVDEGNLVSAGTPLVTIEDLSRVKLVCSLPERYVRVVTAGKTLAHLPDNSCVAVDNVYPALDVVARTGTIEFRLDNPQGRWRSGEFVHVQLDVAYAENVPIIPLAAVSWAGQDAWVFVVEDGRLRRVPIEVGICDGLECEARKGLAPGTQLVVGGTRDLRDGMAVKARAGGGA